MKSLLSALLFGLVSHAFSQEKPIYWPIEIKGRLFSQMETALTKEQTIRGLMFRKSLPEEGGMLFFFDKPEVHRFWMKNTLIPLDILFIDEKGTITAIHTMKAERPRQPQESEFDYENRLPSYSSRKPVIAAIELNAGVAAALELNVGDKITIFPQQLREKKKVLLRGVK